MLRPRTKRVFLVEDIDSISAQVCVQADEDNTNRQFLTALLRATRYAVDHELTERQRQCFTKRYYEGRTVTEIAGELGLDCSTVSRHITLARQRIQSHARYCVFAYRNSLDGYSGNNRS
ncbi:sigma-70 family RNA polymerase sigma factor [Ligaoa zhengdingensis]|uniref:RNA polymerase sigma factor n=1 Tax=Ligaoa zhengdingensis TaxID=2763658 RepID=UPI0031BA5775